MELLEDRIKLEELGAIIRYKAILISLAEIAFNSKPSGSFMALSNKQRLGNIKEDIIRTKEDDTPLYIKDSMKEKYDEIDSVLKLVDEGDYEKAYKNSMEFLKKPITFHKTYTF